MLSRRNLSLQRNKLHPGKKVRLSSGAWVTDLAELRKSILLCAHCSSKFDHKKYLYYKQREFPYALGKCDGCDSFGKCNFYLHWSEVKKCWTIEQKHNDSFRDDYSF